MSKLSLEFIYAFPLDSFNRQNFESRDHNYPDQSEVKDVLTKWRGLWNEVEDKFALLDKLSAYTKRTPNRKLECFVYGAGQNAMSTPFLMPTKNPKGNTWSDEHFLDTIVHELLHIFQSHNTKAYWEFAQEKWSGESQICINHILLYAILFEICSNCFDREPIDFTRDNMPPAYARAIEIVRADGSCNLIREYQSIA